MSGLPDMRGRAAARGDPVGGRPAGIAGASHAQLAGAEHELLVRCRRYDVLQRLGAAASTRASKFQGEISTIVNNIHVRMADAFFLTLQGRDTEELRARHSATTEMLELLRELCGQIEVLTAWRYSEAQCEWARDRLGRVCGWGRHFTPLEGAQPVASVGDIDPEVVDAPFLTAAMFLMVSKDFEMLTLCQMLARASRGRWNRAGTVFVPVTAMYGMPLARFKVDSSEGLGGVVVGLRGGSIASIEFERAWPVTARRHGSNFSPPLLRLEGAGMPVPHQHMIAVPDTDMTFLTLAKEKWERRLGTLPTELASILDGTYTISKSAQILAPIFVRNHKSWEDDEAAQAALWPEVAKMLWRGVLEYVARHCRLPLCIMACGAVPKATAPFYRLITDCRPINEFADPWRVKYISMAGLALLLSPGCFFWVIDLTSAYHATPLGGCGRPFISITRWFRSSSGTSYEPVVTRVFGCTPSDCSGCCDKACMGIMLNGHCFRLASCQFGHKTSNGPLAVLTDAVLKYLSRQRKLDGSCYVDDFIFVLHAEYHGECLGMAGGCAECARVSSKAAIEQGFTHELLDELHLRRNEKGQAYAQQGEYIGIEIDTIKRWFRLTSKKLNKLKAGIVSMLGAQQCSARDMSELHGKMMNYSTCVQRLRPFTAPLRAFIGAPRSDWEWDEQRQGPSLKNVKRILAFVFEHVDAMVALGAPIWPLDASTILHLWTVGRLPADMRVVTLTWDASEFGVALTIRKEPNVIAQCVGREFDRVSTVLTFEDQLDVQAHREAQGGAMAVRVFLESEQPQGTILLCINDCVPALRALQKGSSKPHMQAAAEQLTMDCIRTGQFPMFLHVSGESLVSDGTDEGSRTKARSLQGPACGDWLWEQALQMAGQLGWAMTIDMFAAACNARLPRYMTWTDEGGSEQVDAFAARTWDSSECLSCGRRHAECGWYFPPSGVVNRSVKRAQSDGARGLFLVPTNVKAPYWLALRRVSLAQLEIAANPALYKWSGRDMGRHTLFAADFAESDRRDGDPCPQAFEKREKVCRFTPVEQEEQAAIQRKLRHLAHGAAGSRPACGGVS